MKKFFEILITVVAGLVAGYLLHGCRNHKCTKDAGGTVVSDTTLTAATDTVTHLSPAVTDTTAVGTIVARLPLHKGSGAGGVPLHERNNDSYLNDVASESLTYGMSAGGEPRQCPDSAVVEVPITQKHYADSTYEAWVSGYAPALDSIKIYRRTEIMKIREYKPPNRWHIGITAGTAYTPRGFQPYIGVGVTYSLYSF
ncbi:MAG: hypothetical protein K2H98_03375 [Duncaniella sp.]|nr:hypothetical protein [Duncaniella sp.]